MGIYLAEKLCLPDYTFSARFHKAQTGIAYFSKSLAFGMGLYSAICDSGAPFPVQKRTELWGRYQKIMAELQATWEWDKGTVAELQRRISLDDDIGRLYIDASSLSRGNFGPVCEAIATVHLTKMLTDCLPDLLSDNDNSAQISDMVCTNTTGILAIDNLIPILVAAAKELVAALKDYIQANQEVFDAAVADLTLQGPP